MRMLTTCSNRQRARAPQPSANSMQLRQPVHAMTRRSVSGRPPLRMINLKPQRVGVPRLSARKRQLLQAMLRLSLACAP